MHTLKIPAGFSRTYPIPMQKPAGSRLLPHSGLHSNLKVVASNILRPAEAGRLSGALCAVAMLAAPHRDPRSSLLTSFFSFLFPVPAALLVCCVGVLLGNARALHAEALPYAWGYNDEGDLGDGTYTDRSTPVQVTGLSGVTAMAGGASRSLALRNDGTVWAWGNNVGDGTTNVHYTPVQVTALGGVTAIASGWKSSLALKNDGTVWAWGDNYYGELGDGTSTNRYTPVQVTGLSGVTAIAAGELHSLALKSDGTVWAWGWNYGGQLGDGTTTQRNAPVHVTGLSGVTAVAGAGDHSLALVNDGTVWAWGDNWYGQLGDGTTTERHTPVHVTGLSGVTSIAGGTGHSLALKNDGTVWTWGWNYYGQLGDGTTTERHTPVQVTGLSGVSSIAGGEDHSLALKNDGTVWEWGSNNYGQLGDGTNTNRSTPVLVGRLGGATAIAAGSSSNHSLALGTLVGPASLTVTGFPSPSTVWAAGSLTVTVQDISGRTVTDYMGTVHFTSTDAQAVLPSDYKFLAGDSGSHVFSVTLKTVGTRSITVTNTGASYNISGTQSGITVKPAGASTLVVAGFPIATTAGTAGNMAVTAKDPYGNTATGYTGTVHFTSSDAQAVPPSDYTFVVGDNGIHSSSVTLNTVGTQSITATDAATGSITGTQSGIIVCPGTPTISNVSPASGRTVGGTTVTITGSNFSVLGIVGVKFQGNAARSVTVNSATQITCTTPPGSAGAVDVVVTNPDGQSATMSGAFTYIGPATQPYAWGDNTYGQLGDGTTTQRNTPVLVTGLSGMTAIAGGFYHSLALKNDGTVWAWGYNSDGELGDGTTTQRSTPVQVTGLSGVTAIAAGDEHSLALKNDGTVWAWGYNGCGELGDGTWTSHSMPVQVTGLSGVAAIAGGHMYSLAVKNDGTVWAWGYNSDGELGNGTTTTRRNTPGQVTGLNNVTAIAGGYSHTLALKKDGTVWAWGTNWYGELGDRTGAQQRTTPVQVVGMNSVASIAGGLNYSMALKNDGTLWAWGLNWYGQLGDGTTCTHGAPMQVTGLSGVTAIAGGIWHSLAIKNDGTLWAWGDNSYSQLGDGTTTQRNAPVQVAWLGGTTALARGYYYSLALGTHILPPSITSSTSGNGYVGQPFSYQIAASNFPDSFSASGLPSWASVNTSTGAITGTPNATGSTNATISATNTAGTASATLTITIVYPPPPVITSSTSESGYVWQPFGYVIAASNSPTTYDATGLPARMSVDKSTGAISGFPTTAGTISATISATNAGGTGTAPLTITVNPAPDGTMDVFVGVTLRKSVHIAWGADTTGKSAGDVTPLDWTVKDVGGKQLGRNEICVSSDAHNNVTMKLENTTNTGTKARVSAAVTGDGGWIIGSQPATDTFVIQAQLTGNSLATLTPTAQELTDNIRLTKNADQALVLTVMTPTDVTHDTDVEKVMFVTLTATAE